MERTCIACGTQADGAEDQNDLGMDEPTEKEG